MPVASMQDPTDISAIATLPGLLTLDKLEVGPREGWGFSARGGGMTLVVEDGPFNRVEPIGLAMLSAWADWQRTRGGRTLQVDDSAKGPYAWSRGLLSALAGRPFTGTTRGMIPPTRLVGEREMAEQMGRLVDQLGVVDTATSDVARHALEDLCRNVDHHARAGEGGAHVAASYDSRQGRVRIGVADCGQGIAADIRAHRGEELTDQQAVEIALEPEVSGSERIGVNRGIGLFVVRRLAMAAQGAFWIKTGRVVVRASSLAPDATEVSESESNWQGTAVAVTFLTHRIENFGHAMADIRAALDGHGPQFADVQFFKRDTPTPAWERVSILPDANKVAFDRNRALTIGAQQIVPLLERGANLSIDFANTRTATQAFCHALLAELCRAHGPAILQRLRFIACSDQVRIVIRMAINYGMREWGVPTAPP